MIEMDDVTYAYPGGRRVLDGVCLHTAPGELYLLAGANGVGKSTLLALLAGLFEPDAGRVSVPQGRVRLVMQDADLQILGATVGEDMLLGGSTDEARARALAEDFGLLHAWDEPVQTLSWGQKRKLCLAAALLDDPRVLLLDEPFSGLDYAAALQMRRFLADAKTDGLTLVCAVHDLEPLADLADRIGVLSAQGAIEQGDPAPMMERLAAHGVRPPCSWLGSRTIVPWDEGAEGGGQ